MNAVARAPDVLTYYARTGGSGGQGGPNEISGGAKGLARLRYPLLAAVWRDDHLDPIRGLQPHFPGAERTHRDRRSNGAALDAARPCVRPACSRIWCGHLDVGRTETRLACFRWSVRCIRGARWHRVAICHDAPT